MTFFHIATIRVERVVPGRHRRERVELEAEHHPRRRLLLRHASNPATAQTGRKLGHLPARNATGLFLVQFEDCRFSYITSGPVIPICSLALLRFSPIIGW